MALVKVLRAGQVTLPANVRAQLRVKQGDYLEAEVVEGGLLLKPVSMVEREKAWQRIREAQRSVRYIGPEPRPSPEDEEQMIFDLVQEARNEA